MSIGYEIIKFRRTLQFYVGAKRYSIKSWHVRLDFTETTESVSMGMILTTVPS